MLHWEPYRSPTSYVPYSDRYLRDERQDCDIFCRTSVEPWYCLLWGQTAPSANMQYDVQYAQYCTAPPSSGSASLPPIVPQLAARLRIAFQLPRPACHLQSTQTPTRRRARFRPTGVPPRPATGWTLRFSIIPPPSSSSTLLS